MQLIMRERKHKCNEKCKTCKSFSGRVGAKDGWCLRHKRGTAKERTCPYHRPEETVEYEEEARPVSLYNLTPWD